jgi:hypothetical protein
MRGRRAHSRTLATRALRRPCPESPKGRSTLLVLNLRLHVLDGVRGLHLQRDGLAGERLHKDLHVGPSRHTNSGVSTSGRRRAAHHTGSRGSSALLADKSRLSSAPRQQQSHEASTAPQATSCAAAAPAGPSAHSRPDTAPHSSRTRADASADARYCKLTTALCSSSSPSTAERLGTASRRARKPQKLPARSAVRTGRTSLRDASGHTNVREGGCVDLRVGWREFLC